MRRDDNRHNNAKGKEVWNEQGKGRERTEERSQSTDRPSIAEAEHIRERERERRARAQILTNAAIRCFPPIQLGRVMEESVGVEEWWRGRGYG